MILLVWDKPRNLKRHLTMFHHKKINYQQNSKAQTKISLMNSKKVNLMKILVRMISINIQIKKDLMIIIRKILLLYLN